MSRFLRPVLNVAILGGLVLAAWPFGQSLYGHWSQHELALQWQQEQGNTPAKTHTRTSAYDKNSNGKSSPGKTGNASARLASVSSDSPDLPGESSKRKKAKVAPWPLTKLSIPDIGLETFIVQGWDEAALRRGPGHWEQSAPAGQGNCVVAGHRNIYGSPFYRLDDLMPGSTITLSNRKGTFNYTVNAVFPTPDFNRTILAPPAAGQSPLLTLITCTVPHTGNRIVVQATLSE